MESTIMKVRILIIVLLASFCLVSCSGINSSDESLFHEFDDGLSFKITVSEDVFQSEQSVEITFALPSAGGYVLEILNATGYNVRAFSGTGGPGRVMVVWDLTNSDGKPVDPAIYIFEIAAGAFRARDVEVIMGEAR